MRTQDTLEYDYKRMAGSDSDQRSYGRLEQPRWLMMWDAETSQVKEKLVNEVKISSRAGEVENHNRAKK